MSVMLLLLFPPQSHPGHFLHHKIICISIYTCIIHCMIFKWVHRVCPPGAYVGLILGRCWLRKNWGWGGLPPQKHITFDPFVNNIMVIWVNFLEFVNFLSLLFPWFLSDCFFGVCSPPHIRAWCPPKSTIHVVTQPLHYTLRLHN